MAKLNATEDQLKSWILSPNLTNWIQRHLIHKMSALEIDRKLNLLIQTSLESSDGEAGVNAHGHFTALLTREGLGFLFIENGEPVVYLDYPYTLERWLKTKTKGFQTLSPNQLAKQQKRLNQFKRSQKVYTR